MGVDGFSTHGLLDHDIPISEAVSLCVSFQIDPLMLCSMFGSLGASTISVRPVDLVRVEIKSEASGSEPVPP